MSDVYERAEQALDGITERGYGWETRHEFKELTRVVHSGEWEGSLAKCCDCGVEAGYPNPADAEFIADAPALVADLLAALREARREGHVLADTEELLRSHRDDLRAERDEWKARAHEAAGASLAAQKWHGTHSERMESERDVARAERDEAIKARWRTQDTLARVRELADRYEVITPAILHHALQEDTDGGH